MDFVLVEVDFCPSMCVCDYVNVSICACVCLHVRIRLCVCAFMCTCKYVCVCALFFKFPPVDMKLKTLLKSIF